MVTELLRAYGKCPACGADINLRLARGENSAMRARGVKVACRECGQRAVFDVPSPEVEWRRDV